VIQTRFGNAETIEGSSQFIRSQREKDKEMRRYRPQIGRGWTPKLLILLGVTLPVSIRGAVPPAQEDRNKVIATRVFEEIFNQGKFQVADEIYAPDFKNHGLHRDVDLKVDQDAVRAEKQAFPNLRMKVDMLVAERDLVTALWTFRGTHTGGGYAGLPPTGTKVEMRGITIWRIVDGRIRDEWSAFNELHAYSQLIAHLRWLLVLAFISFVAAVVLGERTLCWAAAKIYAKLKR
jgi:predicted ester cyclase